MARATALRDAVKKRFYPFVEGKGFARGNSSGYFTEFRRVRAEGVHLFDIQWDKYWRPLFVLNFHQGPARGAEGVNDANLEGSRFQQHAGRLQRRRGGRMGCWFGLRRPWIRVLTSGRWSYSPDEVVDELIDAFGELEAWWEDRSEGPHIYILRAAA
jgi:hypothetical protein